MLKRDSGKSVFKGSMQLAQSFCFLFAALSLLSCGRKGDLRPPGATAPKPIPDLRAEVSRDGVTLVWSRPTEDVGGARLESLAEFAVYREARALDPNCVTCSTSYQEVARVAVEDQQMLRKARTFRLIQRGLTAGTVYRYKVFSLTLDGTRSDASNEVEVQWGAGKGSG
jgi:hypothetical protein